jgi:hypothetical protein
MVASGGCLKSISIYSRIKVVIAYLEPELWFVPEKTQIADGGVEVR